MCKYHERSGSAATVSTIIAAAHIRPMTKGSALSETNPIIEYWNVRPLEKLASSWQEIKKCYV